MLAMLLVAGLAGARQVPASSCADAGLSQSSAEVCLGRQEEQIARPLKVDREKMAHLTAAADHYRRAVTLASKAEDKQAALTALLKVCDHQHLNDLARMEQVARELAALNPNDAGPWFELARAQEDDGQFDWAEATLIDVRRQQSENPESYKRLAQFYARRATAMTRKAEPPRTDAAPGQADDKGVFQVGGEITPPPRLDRPVYPTEALTAGVEGVVVVQIVINEQGEVADTKVVRSIPMLDDAALEAVRTWRYKPTNVRGNAVPVRMNVTVNFTRQ